MMYWFVNVNFNLMLSSLARSWKKKGKINKQWAFILHLKNSSFLVVSWKVKKWGRGGKFKITCLTDNRMNIDVNNGT